MVPFKMNKYKLVCFDVDGTIVLEHKEKLLAHTKYLEPHEFEDSIWVTLHRYFGVTKDAKEQYKQYNAGMISYKQWVSMNIQLWKDAGATKQVIHEIFKEFTIKTPNAQKTLEELKKQGIKIAIISGGIKDLVKYHYPDTFDEIFANEILYDNAGSIVGSASTPYDFGGKLEGVRQLCKKYNITMAEVAFIGDNINDFQVMEEVGLGIAFNSKSEALNKASTVTIGELDLEKILPHILE